MAKKIDNENLPTFDKMLIPTLEAIRQLGGSGSIEEINETVYKISDIPEEVLEIKHNDNGVLSEVDYRLAWSRTYLKKYGLIDNSSRGIWALLDNESDFSDLDPNEIVRYVREMSQKSKGIKDSVEYTTDNSGEETVNEDLVEELDWKENLLSVLLSIEPFAFERLCQRLLRESGFVQVEVTNKTGDGGIDGKGIVRISGFLSFHVFFQSKRYRGSVGSGDIRDFRGAMQGRADKGIFITTGNFTREAIKEATRDGAPAIDLIDGELLCEKLKEFNLGVRTDLIEEVTISAEWFDKI